MADHSLCFSDDFINTHRQKLLCLKPFIQTLKLLIHSAILHDLKHASLEMVSFSLYMTDLDTLIDCIVWQYGQILDPILTG